MTAGTRSRRADERKRQIEDLTRLAILDAAEEVIGERGYSESGIREIAARADISVGAVYQLFKSKEDLFAQLLARRGDECIPAMAQVIDSDRAPVDKLERLTEFTVDYFRANPDFARVMLQSSFPVMGSWAVFGKRSLQRYDDATAKIAALFAEGIDAGVFHPGDPLELARIHAGIMHAFYLSDIDRPEDALERAVADLMALIRRAFLR